MQCGRQLQENTMAIDILIEESLQSFEMKQIFQERLKEIEAEGYELTLSETTLGKNGIESCYMRYEKTNEA